MQKFRKKPVEIEAKARLLLVALAVTALAYGVGWTVLLASGARR